MRNWNLVSAIILTPSTWIASLPMRNWNMKYNQKIPRYELIASLPMRNWNPEKSRWIYISIIYCQPTYEELKQVKLTQNLKIFFILPAYLWGIETEYSIYNIIEHIQIASLPMRNWNQIRQWIVFTGILDCQPTYEELKLYNLQRILF